MQRDECKKRRLFAQHFFFRIVVSLSECYFLIKYLYSFEEESQKLDSKKEDTYLKTVVFLVIPLKY